MTLSTLITAVLVLVILGFLLYLLFTYVPMPEPFKTIIMVVVVIALVLYLLQALGIWHGFAAVALPRPLLSLVCILRP